MSTATAPPPSSKRRPIGKTTTILIVDDDREFVDSLVRALQLDERFEDITITAAYSGEEALEAFGQDSQVAVMISDIDMPGMNGMELIELVKKISPMTVRIMISGAGGYDEVVRGINEGGIFYYLSKPFDTDGLGAILKQGIWHYNVTTTEHELVESTLKNVIRLLVDLLALVSPDAHKRALRVREIVAKICRRLKVKPNWNYEVAALLAQFITINLPPDLMTRFLDNEVLEESERASILQNAKTVYEMLRRIPRLEYVAAAVLYQNKHYDGKGYPRNGVSGKKIVFGGRLLKVALDFELMISSGTMEGQALEAMHASLGVYDPDLLAALDAEILGLKAGITVRRLQLCDLVEGMIPAFDIVNTNGIKILPANNKLTSELIERLRTIARFHSIVEPVFIYRRMQLEDDEAPKATLP